MDAAADSELADSHRPCEAHIDPDGGLRCFGQQPDELDGALFAPLHDPDVLGRGESFVPCDAAERLTKRAAKSTAMTKGL
jgi:hypothetical protein